MARYRKLPVVIEAKELTLLNFEEIEEFVGGDSGVCPDKSEDHRGCLVIATLEGAMHATIGDFIIKGVKGEFYPCKPDIFFATYEEVAKNDAMSGEGLHR